MRIHESHRTRVTIISSAHDEICELCGRVDRALEQPCPVGEPKPFDTIRAGLEEASALDLNKIDKTIADLIEALNGCEGTFYSKARNICVTITTVSCPECNGLGYEADNPDALNKCPACKGEGT